MKKKEKKTPKADRTFFIQIMYQKDRRNEEKKKEPSALHAIQKGYYYSILFCTFKFKHYFGKSYDGRKYESEKERKRSGKARIFISF